ncbi:non-specific lipid-transfer protein [Salix suchowensis]|nr:non-specific lipid-transfer protein [Salix suchowensis]
MAAIRMEVLLAISLAATLCAGAMAQSSCTNVIISMSPCLNYITGNSSSPSSSCCTQLANVVKSQPQCLCEVVNGGASSLGVNVNQTQALALPSACNVQTPLLAAVMEHQILLLQEQDLRQSRQRIMEHQMQTLQS